jgi:hypothetical protein
MDETSFKPALPDLSVGVVSWNTRDLLRACLESVRCNAGPRRVEVCVVDNASSDGSPAMVRGDFPEARLVANSENVGFARAANQVWQAAQGRYWLLLNPDAVLKPGCLEALVSFMDAHTGAGLATARLEHPDGSPQYCAQAAPSILRTLIETARLHKALPRHVRGKFLLGPYWTYDEPIEVGWTWGTALIARREAVHQVGPLDEGFFMYGEDVEWCLRMRRAGWEVWFCPDAEVMHHGGGSARQRWQTFARSREICRGYYRAVESHRGRLYVRALQLANLLGLAAEAALSAVRGRPRSEGLADALACHLDLLGIPFSRRRRGLPC